MMAHQGCGRREVPQSQTRLPNDAIFRGHARDSHFYGSGRKTTKKLKFVDVRDVALGVPTAARKEISEMSKPLVTHVALLNALNGRYEAVTQGRTVHSGRVWVGALRTAVGTVVRLAWVDTLTGRVTPVVTDGASRYYDAATGEQMRLSGSADASQCDRAVTMGIKAGSVVTLTRAGE